MNAEQPTPTAMDPNAPVRVETLPHAGALRWPMTWYFLTGKLYSLLPWKKTAWTCAGFPIELLLGLDIFPLHPENMATVAAAQKQSRRLIEHAESMGYSRDLCSYCKTNIGAVDTGAPLKHGGIARPDIITCTNTICDTHWKWFQIQAEKLDVPLFVFDCPKIVSGTDDRTIDGYINYMVEQFFDFFDFVKKHTGKKPDIDRMIRAAEQSERLSVLWRDIYEYRKRIPSPYGMAETSASFFPLVVMPGVRSGIRFFEKILGDIRQRADQGKGTLTGQERYRLLFEGIPFWYRMRFMYDLARYGAVVVYEPYTYSFAAPKPLNLGYMETLRHVARTMMDVPYSFNLDKRIAYFKQAIREYRIDGVILHENLSCRPSSTGMIDLKNALQQECDDIPVLIIQCDMNDPRAFSEAQINTRIEGFVELMEKRKK